MSERLPCQTPGCAHTILPETAARNGGRCAPCVQAAARREREDYIRRHRRDLDEFAGLTDPVEILGIIHQPRRHDPLVNWIPHPTPTSELYAGLSHADGGRLAEYAAGLLDDGREDEADNIILCLSTFTQTNLDACLRVLLAQERFWPGLLYRRAPADVRDELLARVEADAGTLLRNHLLTALAWISDAAVVDRFEHWRCEPPSWRGDLHVPPQDYPREAGWELAAGGHWRDLFFGSCTALMRGPSARPTEFLAAAPRNDTCPWCRGPLTDLLRLDAAAFGLDMGRPSRVEVTTCEVCTAFGPVFGTLDGAGRGRWSAANRRPGHLPADTTSWARLPADTLRPGPRRPPWFAADQFLPVAFSQVGGLPTWIQDADYPRCPGCARTMMFLAQLDHGDMEDHSEGVYYAFLCPDCRTTATSYQQT